MCTAAGTAGLWLAILDASAKPDDDNKTTPYLIKQVRENSNKDAVKTFYILMRQVGTSVQKEDCGES